LLTLVGNRVVVNPDGPLIKHARARGWAILQLKRASIREAQRRVRREGRVSTGRSRRGLVGAKAASKRATKKR